MIADLQSSKTIYDLASLLEIPAKTLAFLLYKLPDDKKYHEKSLSKKGGGTRVIKAPDYRLKELQRKLSDLLYTCQSEIGESHAQRRSFGFERNVGIYENALSHANKRWVFNIDLLDFFPSINFGRVRGYFCKNADFSLEPRIATLISQIACHDNSLPQGAPSSPVISNLICGSLDYRLSKLAKRALCNYSRYVDDITFSTNQKNFPDLIAIETSDPQGWAVSDELVARICGAGFLINPSKTRMSFRRSRQVVTGLVVNSKPSVKREFYKNTRATIHRMMRGQPWSLERFSDPFRLNCENEEVQTDEFSAIEGRIAFAYQLDDKKDRRKASAKFFHPTGVARTYSNLLFMKYFTNLG